ncbi:MAG: SURF1 family protein [Desertimonas sp.]
MYRFLLSPRWLLFHLLVIMAMAGMIWAGMWQLRRLDQREAFNAAVEARIDEPAVPIDDLLDGVGLADDATLDDLEWRPVTVTGVYLADETITVVNKSQGGVAGTFAVTPLAIDDSRLVLIERGFSALGVTQAAGSTPPPDGVVDVVGRLRPTQQRRTGGLSDPAEGDLTEAQRIDIARLSPQLDGDVAPMYVELTSSTPAEADTLAPIAAPELSEGPHLSYAIQWFIFTVCVAVGWVLAVRRSVATRRRDARSAPAPG